MTYILRFTDPLAQQRELSGGKGANLARLTQQGFNVPSGFIVTVQAYRQFMSNIDPPSQVRKWNFDKPKQIHRYSEELRIALKCLDLPEDLVAEIKTQLQKYPANQSFSVRSSATMEDSAGAAFAGQHDTFLNCVGLENILTRIEDCFVSLWYDRAITYRHRHGFSQREAAMAVVVQQMIASEVAGVGFSINPVNGYLDEIVIDANFGLGESVVSGTTEVDHWVIDKESAHIISEHIATKTTQVVVTKNGTISQTIPAIQASEPCLNETQLNQLINLILTVENHYGFPQDIEWGIADGQLYLLQARPITTIPPRWTRDESAERFPNVVTPLTWDFVGEGFHKSLNFSFKLMNYPPYQGKWFELHEHYVYGNQNAVEIYARRAPFSLRSLEDLRALIPKIREEFRWVQELPVIWSRDLDYYLIRIGEFMAEPLVDKDLQNLWQLVQAINEHGSQYFLPNIAISLTQSVLYRLLSGLLQLVCGPQQAPKLFDDLLAYVETKTGIVNRELFTIANNIRRHPKLLRCLRRKKPSRQLLEEGTLTQFPEFMESFQRFLRDHGHREIDFDPYHGTWVEAPWIVLDNIRLLMEKVPDQTPADRELELSMRMQEAEFKLFQRLPEDLHFFFHELIRLARVYTSLDDLEHYQTTRLTLPLRRVLKEIGQRLVKRGILQSPLDLFFAHLTALDEAIQVDNNETWQRLTKVIAEEKLAYSRDQARTPEWILGETSSEVVSSNILSGLAGSAGQAEGRVYIVNSIDDFAHFPTGAILVARTTNPAWTPLFYNALAVITESGGPLSHGAVTAREMQIPAVMGVRGAFVHLKTGCKVKVDGSLGKVYLLESTKG